MREIRDTRGVSKEAMAGIVPEPWLEWGLGAEGDQAPRTPEADILAAHDAVTTNSTKAQQKAGQVSQPAAGDVTPAGTWRPAWKVRDEGPRQGSLQEPPRGRSYRMPSGEADRLAPGHTRSRVRGHGKALPRDRGARGSEVPLLQRNQRGHPVRTHLSQSWSASEPAPATSPCDLPHFEALRNSTPGGERRTVHCGKEPADGYRHQARKSSRRSEPGI